MITKLTKLGDQANGPGELTPEMQEILDHTDQQEDHGDTQADKSQDTQESQLTDTITGRNPKQISQKTKLGDNPSADILENLKDSGNKRISQEKHLTKIFLINRPPAVRTELFIHILIAHKLPKQGTIIRTALTRKRTAITNVATIVVSSFLHLLASPSKTAETNNYQGQIEPDKSKGFLFHGTQGNHTRW